METLKESLEKVNKLIVENEWHKTQWKSSRSFRECHERISQFLQDLLNKHMEQEEELKEHMDLIEELQGFIDELEEMDDQLQKDIDALEKEDANIWDKINLILQYYEQNQDGETLSHKYDTFPLLYNSQYVKDNKTVIKVDPLAGVVHYDIRLYMKEVPADTPIVIAKCPPPYMPTLSAPCSYAVRERYFDDDLGYYEALKFPTLKDGKAFFAFTREEEYGRVIIRPKDAIAENEFLYLTGTYFLKPASVGRFDLDKTLAEHETFVKEDKLEGGAS